MLCTAIEQRIEVEGQARIDLRYCACRVSGDGMPARDMTFAEFIPRLGRGVDSFVGLVEKANPGIKQEKIKNDTPLKLEYEKQDDGKWHLQCRLGDLEVDLSFNPNVVPPAIRIERPHGFNVEWQTYRLWVEAMRRFISTVQVACGLEAKAI